MVPLGSAVPAAVRSTGTQGHLPTQALHDPGPVGSVWAQIHRDKLSLSRHEPGTICFAGESAEIWGFSFSAGP